MREIKIRGRDKKGTILGIMELSQNPKYYPEWFIDRNDDVRIELSTGYIDKNNNEIFEGDTIKITCYGDEIKSRYTGKVTKKRTNFVYTEKVEYIPTMATYNLAGHLIFVDQVGNGDGQKEIELKK
jgi:uncharacterized phage protein (TIGR01671 family)